MGTPFRELLTPWHTVPLLFYRSCAETGATLCWRVRGKNNDTLPDEDPCRMQAVLVGE